LNACSPRLEFDSTPNTLSQASSSTTAQPKPIRCTRSSNAQIIVTFDLTYHYTPFLQHPSHPHSNIHATDDVRQGSSAHTFCASRQLSPPPPPPHASTTLRLRRHGRETQRRRVKSRQVCLQHQPSPAHTLICLALSSPKRFLQSYVAASVISWQ
jgi:hypothetical protein